MIRGGIIQLVVGVRGKVLTLSLDDISKNTSEQGKTDWAAVPKTLKKGAFLAVSESKITTYNEHA